MTAPSKIRKEHFLLAQMLNLKVTHSNHAMEFATILVILSVLHIQINVSISVPFMITVVVEEEEDSVERKTALVQKKNFHFIKIRLIVVVTPLTFVEG